MLRNSGRAFAFLLLGLCLPGAAYAEVIQPDRVQAQFGPVLHAGAIGHQQCRDDLALIVRPDGTAQAFTVEIADTEPARAQGLMFRRDLPPGHGMLFVYDAPRPVSFWMRNTLIPLDLVFFDARGVIRHIHPDARPLDETPIPGATEGDPSPERLMVLEIGGGEAARLGLSTGQVLAHPRLDPGLAAQPCR